MATAKLKTTVTINMQAVRYLDNLEKRVHRFQIRLTTLEFQALEEEAKEANKSVAEIIRTRLWPK